MKKLQYKVLSDGEKEIVLAARPEQLRQLDEDELLALHKRVRRARNKYSKLYRRRAAAQVGDDRARGKASKKQARTASKAEIFEDVLARVSRQLAVVARQNATTLRDERIAASRPERSGHASAPHDEPAPAGGSGPKRRARDRKPVEERKNAGSRASGRRKQAGRDAR